MAETLRERCDRRLKGMQAQREWYESEWKQIAKLALPSRARFLDRQPSRKRPGPLLDEHGIHAFRTLTAGMTSGLSSPSRPWFTLAAPEEMMEDYAVRAWLSDVEQRMYAFLARTNFYGAVKEGYAELGGFGVEACVMDEHDVHGAVCHQLAIGQYWIAADEALQVDTLYRSAPMTVRQAVHRFGTSVSIRVRERYDRGDYEEAVKVFHAIEPRRDRDPRSAHARDMPWGSTYWDEQDDRRTVLSESGYPEQPFWAPRWATIGADPWGSDSPGSVALSSLRELQLQAKRRNEAIDFLIKPERLAKAGIELTGQPGNVVTVPNAVEKAVQVPYLMPYQGVQAIGEQLSACRESIDRASFADLFLAITNMNGIQPRNVEEIASRNEEKLTQLGPVIERVNGEKLAVAIDRAFGIMLRMNLLPEPPQELQGERIDPSFVSILTQMQRMVGIGQIERTAGFIGNLAGVFPDAVDKLDVDEMIDDYAARAGVPAKLIRTTEMVKAIRDARAQQQQATAAAEAMPAVQQGADAARLLSETDIGGASLLDRLMPA